VVENSFKKKYVHAAPLIEPGVFAHSLQFKERSVPVKKDIYVLAPNNMDVDDDEASVILDFLLILNLARNLTLECL